MTQCEHPNSECRMPEGHGNNVKCRFHCPDCGEEYDTDGSRCFRGMVVTTNVSMPVSADTQESQMIVRKEVTQAIGETFIEYALAENTLRRLLQRLPGHREKSTISEDLGRLQKWLPRILEDTPDVEGLRADIDGCVKDLRSAFDAVNGKRNTLAHGQLVAVSSTIRTVMASGEHIPAEPNGTRWEISHQDHGTVSLTEPEISEVLEAAIELRRKVGVVATMMQLRQYVLEDQQNKPDSSPDSE